MYPCLCFSAAEVVETFNKAMVVVAVVNLGLWATTPIVNVCLGVIVADLK